MGQAIREGFCWTTGAARKRKKTRGGEKVNIFVHQGACIKTAGQGGDLSWKDSGQAKKQKDTMSNYLKGPQWLRQGALRMEGEQKKVATLGCRNGKGV